MDGGTILKSVDFWTVFLTKMLKKDKYKILDEIGVSVLTNDIEACHCMGSSVGHSKRKIVRSTNRKLCEKVLLNRSKLQKIPSTSRN